MWFIQYFVLRYLHTQEWIVSEFILWLYQVPQISCKYQSQVQAPSSIFSVIKVVVI